MAITNKEIEFSATMQELAKADRERRKRLYPAKTKFISEIPKSKDPVINKISQEVNKYNHGGPSYKETLDRVCKKYGVSLMELHSRARKMYIAQARQECYFILKYEFKKSVTQIAEYFQRDHSTICDGLYVYGRGVVNKRAGKTPEKTICGQKRYFWDLILDPDYEFKVQNRKR